MLSKVEGRRVDVAVKTANATRKDLPGWDDLRHVKRLADHRWGNASRLLQFCFVGASGAVVDLFCYWLFQKLYNATPLMYYVVWPTRVKWSLAMAGSSAILVALLWNFTLNRRLTFSYARRGSLPRQCLAYIVSNLPGVMVSLAIRLLLPRKVTFFNDHKLAAAVVGIVVATGLSFSMSRWVVFRRKPEDDAREAAEGPSGTPLLRTSASAIS
jgi:dolichol-phosphate mannosyltransferase